MFFADGLQRAPVTRFAVCAVHVCYLIWTRCGHVLTHWRTCVVDQTSLITGTAQIVIGALGSLNIVLRMQTQPCTCISEPQLLQHRSANAATID